MNDLKIKSSFLFAPPGRMPGHQKLALILSWCTVLDFSEWLRTGYWSVSKPYWKNPSTTLLSLLFQERLENPSSLWIEKSYANNNLDNSIVSSRSEPSYISLVVFYYLLLWPYLCNHKCNPNWHFLFIQIHFHFFFGVFPQSSCRAQKPPTPSSCLTF